VPRNTIFEKRAIQIAVGPVRVSRAFALPWTAWNACIVLAIGLHGLAFVATPRGTTSVHEDEAPPDHPIIDVATEVDPEPVRAPDVPKAADVANATHRSASARGAPQCTPAGDPPHAVPLREAPGRAAPPVATALVTTAAPPRFTMTLAANSRPNGPGLQTGPVAMAGISGPGSDDVPLPEDAASSPARPLGSMVPAYPELARAQEVEADVLVAFVVTTSGAVADARVVKPAGMGFDEAALAAVRAGHYQPAEQNGHPVAVRMQRSFSFRLER
jgi:TonB family protein